MDRGYVLVAIVVVVVCCRLMKISSSREFIVNRIHVAARCYDLLLIDEEAPELKKARKRLWFQRDSLKVLVDGVDCEESNGGCRLWMGEVVVD